jgi:PAS domain S-box-containing protein
LPATRQPAKKRIVPHNQLTAAEYRTVVNHSPVLIWRSGIDSKCDYFNETWLAFTGRTTEQEKGDGWAEGVHPEDFDRCVSYYREHFDRREPFEMEYRLRRHDGVYRWVLDRGAPFHDEAGEFAGFIGSCIDVDDHRRLVQERELRDEKTLAGMEEFERWVLGIVSHDIRSPLGSILNSTQLIEAASEDPGIVRQAIARVSRGAQRIRHLVDDLLDVTRERRGGIPISIREVCLVEVCRQSVEESRLAFPDRIFELIAPAGLRGRWDPNRIAQVVSNLTSNAVHHGTVEAPIFIRVEEIGMDAVIAVENRGRIPDDALPKLFEAFQGASPTVRRSEGLGLGLFIASSIVRAHGGSIDVESDGERDATSFRVRLPMGMAERPAPSANPTRG